MTDPDDSTSKSSKSARNAAREARLAAALRENLKRRKGQLRDKARTPAATGDGASGDLGESDGTA